MVDQATHSRGESTPAVGEVLAQKYRVERIVGHGGMGVVIAARHLQLGQTVAIKLLKLPDDEERRDEAIGRFLHEAQAAARLQTDHVVRIYDVGQLESGLPFIVMELLTGSDLDSVLEERGQLPEAEAVDLVLQACAGIAEAHQMGIVHRDLKPSNLFVTRRSDGLPLLKVLDFGISKQVTDPDSGEAMPTFTNARTLMGSPNYMSPEQIRDARRVDARADVWAMGIILQELVTGAQVFQADSFPGVCAAIIADPPLPVRSLRPDVSEKLEQIIARCLQKDPQLRYQSIADLQADLGPLGARAAAPGSPARGVVYSTPPRQSGVKPIASRNAAPPRESATEASAPPTSLRRHGPDPTLESARLASAGTHSPLSSPDSRREPDLEPSPQPPPPRSPARFALPLGLGLLLLGGGLWWQLRPSPPAALDAAPSASEAADNGFTLVIDSTPPGATVSEGSTHLGVTPFSLSLVLPEGATPRVFVIEKEGFQPYVLRQGPARGEVRAQAALSPLAAPAAAANAQSVASAASPAPPAPLVKAPPPAFPRRPAPSGKLPSPKPPSDIRLER
jgi:eukaryotic-like serine/threonine-protein kinase